jgi:hypothetical protein
MLPAGAAPSKARSGEDIMKFAIRAAVAALLAIGMAAALVQSAAAAKRKHNPSPKTNKSSTQYLRAAPQK